MYEQFKFLEGKIWVFRSTTGQYWFCAADIAKLLNIKKAHVMVANHAKNPKLGLPIPNKPAVMIYSFLTVEDAQRIFTKHGHGQHFASFVDWVVKDHFEPDHKPTTPKLRDVTEEKAVKTVEVLQESFLDLSARFRDLMTALDEVEAQILTLRALSQRRAITKEE